MGAENVSCQVTRPPRVSIEKVSFEFVDASPPVGFIQNVQTGEVAFGSDMGEIVEMYQGQFYTFGWDEGDGSDSGRLDDGDTFFHDGQQYRVFSPSVLGPALQTVRLSKRPVHQALPSPIAH